MKTKIILCLFLTLIACKRTKEKEFNDPAWRQESLEIAFGICTKLELCAQEEISKLKNSLQKYAKDEIRPEKCSEKNKKSRVYLLKGNDPIKIKEVSRECFSQIQKFSCADIKSGILKTTKPCEEMHKIQQGAKL